MKYLKIFLVLLILWSDIQNPILLYLQQSAHTNLDTYLSISSISSWSAPKSWSKILFISDFVVTLMSENFLWLGMPPKNPRSRHWTLVHFPLTILHVPNTLANIITSYIIQHTTYTDNNWWYWQILLYVHWQTSNSFGKYIILP